MLFFDLMASVWRLSRLIIMRSLSWTCSWRSPSQGGLSWTARARPASSARRWSASPSPSVSGRTSSSPPFPASLHPDHSACYSRAAPGVKERDKITTEMVKKQTFLVLISGSVVTSLLHHSIWLTFSSCTITIFLSCNVHVLSSSFTSLGRSPSIIGSLPFTPIWTKQKFQFKTSCGSKQTLMCFFSILTVRSLDL